MNEIEILATISSTLKIIGWLMLVLIIQGSALVHQGRSK